MKQYLRIMGLAFVAMFCFATSLSALIVSGNAYVDANTNSMFDTGEGISNAIIVITDVNLGTEVDMVASGTDGFFEFDVPPSDYMITYSYPSTCYTGGQSTIFVVSNTGLTGLNLPFTGGTTDACKFQITVKTDNDGDSNDDQFTFPGSGTNYDISWVDVNDATVTGSVTATDEVTITFPAAGTYKLSINGGDAGAEFDQVDFSSGGDEEKLIAIDNWGNIEWADMTRAFDGTSNLVTYNATDIPNLSSVTQCFYTFRGSAFNGDISGWDVSSVTDMFGMFSDDIVFNQDISGWDVSNVTTFTSMFGNAKTFNQPIGAWNISSATSVASMFASAESFNQDLSLWSDKLGNLTSLDLLFYNAESFNGDIGGWDVSTITNMRGLFGFCDSFNQDISSWSVGNVTNMMDMFGEALVFDQDISGWDVSSVSSMSAMFNKAESFDQDISGWNVSSATDMANMFRDCKAFDQDISGWNVSNVTDMTYMFLRAETFNQDLNTWNVSNVTSMEGAFYDATAFNGDISTWDVSAVTDMESMFNGASAFDGDISGWDVGMVTSMRTMFQNATSFNQDISSWNTSNVTNLNVMFINASAFDQNIGAWDLNADVTMSNMMFGSGMSTASYSSTLDGWAANPNTPSGRTFSGSDLEYCDATSRNILVNDKGWTITGDSQATGCNFEITVKTDNDGDSNDDQFKFPGSGNNYNISWVDVSDASVTGSVTATNTTTITFPTAGIYKLSIGGGDAGEEFDRLQFYFGSGDSKKVISIDNWGIVRWSSMSNAFGGTTNLVSYTATDAPDLSSANSLDNMFGFSAFNGDIGNWDVSSIEFMSGMFNGNASFNQDISNWDVSNTRLFSFMFSGATSFNQPIGSWDISSAEGIDRMFIFASSFNQDLSQWGGKLANVTSLDELFAGASSFNSNIGGWDVSTITNMQKLFAFCTNFNQDISGWDVQNVTDMSQMFQRCKAFNQDISSWNVGNVSDMSSMFDEAEVFDQDLSSWDVSSATDLSAMFSDCKAFNQDLSSWDVQNVTSTSAMFGGAEVFNQDLSSWEVGNVTNMSNMFTNALAFNSDISNWDVSAVTTMSAMFSGASAFNADLSSWEVGLVTFTRNMFSGASSFNQDLSSWDVSNVGDMIRMFFGASAFDQDIGDWDLKSDVTMNSMLDNSGMSIPSYDSTLGGWAANVNTPSNRSIGALGLEYCDASTRDILIDDKEWTITGDSRAVGCDFEILVKTDNTGSSNNDQFNFASFDADYMIVWEEVGNPSNNGVESNITGNITIDFPSAGTYKLAVSGGTFSSMSYPSFGASDATKMIDILSWGKIKWTSLERAFTGASNLTNYSAQDKPDLSQVTRLIDMFRGSAFNGDISDWDVSTIEFFNAMFQDSDFNQDISGWDVSSGTRFGAMFRGNVVFNQDIGNWDVSSATSLTQMFLSAESFNQDLNDWDVSSVTDMSVLFNRADVFNGDISGWDVSAVTNMRSLFESADVFNQDISAWDVSSVTDMNTMFSGAEVFNQDIGSWDVSSVVRMENIFIGASAFNQDISGWDVSNVTSFNSAFRFTNSFDQNLGAWSLESVTLGGISNMFENSNLSIDNYDATLIGWANNTDTPANLALGATGLKYCDETGRDLLTESVVDGGKGWTITGDALNVNLTCYADTDGDGKGDRNSTVDACDTCPTGSVANDDDCDDTDAAIQLAPVMIEDECYDDFAAANSAATAMDTIDVFADIVLDETVFAYPGTIIRTNSGDTITVGGLLQLSEHKLLSRGADTGVLYIPSGTTVRGSATISLKVINDGVFDPREVFNAAIKDDSDNSGSN